MTNDPNIDDVKIDLEDEKEEGEEKKVEGDPKQKIEETPEARSARLARMSDQHDKKHGLGKYAEKETPENKTTELGYGEKAFLIANGVKGSEETDLVKNFMKETGKTLEQTLDSSYFQSELREFREAKASGDAIPKGSKRSGNPTSDSVEYWLAKGELPPADQRELRQKVVNAKIAGKTSKNVFTDNPVA